jgi:hypothetical protein
MGAEIFNRAEHKSFTSEIKFLKRHNETLLMKKICRFKSARIHLSHSRALLPIQNNHRGDKRNQLKWYYKILYIFLYLITHSLGVFNMFCGEKSPASSLLAKFSHLSCFRVGTRVSFGFNNPAKRVEKFD